MNERPQPRLMVPFQREIDFRSMDGPLIIYGRGATDYQSDCLAFKAADERAMTRGDVARLRALGAHVCYVYDMLDLENREFTRDGFLAINADIRRAIEWGFTHILVSNAYLIELMVNEYRDCINVVISPLLECNSSRARVFFDVLNDTSSISHVIVSQNRLTERKFEELRRAFTGFELVVEVDRWGSDIQMVHEHYYNVLYGYHHPDAVRELTRLVRSAQVRRHVIPCKPFLLNRTDVTYKIGDINAAADVVRNNVEAVVNGTVERIRLVDVELWQPVEHAVNV